MRRFPLATLLLATLSAGACSPLLSDDEARNVIHSGYLTRIGDQLSGTGRVEWFGIEGGFFAIRGDDGNVYDPMNLPPAFARDGVRVRFTARVRPDVGSVHMVGEIVEIQQISAA
jgi:hypothetical protein